VQVNTAGYRAPGQFPDGAVLVVGSAQSGCQITEDLLAAGRRVLLAPGRGLSLPALARAGVTLVGRPVAVDGERVSFVDPALVATDGTPCRQDAAGPVPGLWYLGLRWLRRRGSGILLGFPGDAAVVADAVGAHLGG
jgi:cation diffusion facilitator CzcD-associated flavoprotein CzcO